MKKKKEIAKIEPLVKKRINKIEVNCDSEGNLDFPIEINASLTLLNLGSVEWENPNYHSEKNIFPVGFKTIREHGSIKQKGMKAKYTCEILKGTQGKPQFKIIPHEEPDKVIIRDSSTACWVIICQKVNDLADTKRQKVTVSGTERFGLCDPNVIKLIQDLPNVEKCKKYQLKELEE